CQCNIANGYVGDGFTCRLFCHSHDDCDWPRARCNAENNCECISGYTGDGMQCRDVDECLAGLATDCSENATCVNSDGGYECNCNNGYSGDGKTCNPLPTRCDDIPKRKNKRYYLIDPDFTGPANAFWVRQQLLPSRLVSRLSVGCSLRRFVVVFYYLSKVNIGFFSCTPGFSLFPGTSWRDVNGNSHNNWGSSLENTCTCGELQRCPSSCYCDGSQTDESTTDEARVVDKSQLPLVAIEFSQGQRDKGRVDVEPMMCSTKPIEVPKDCHEAKFEYGIEEDQPLFINLGGDEPFLVFCDMESYEHVGITQIPTSNG
ncbi:pro-epidermal growth factor, partial [Elysia marginata]